VAGPLRGYLFLNHGLCDTQLGAVVILGFCLLAAFIVILFGVFIIPGPCYVVL